MSISKRSFLKLSGAALTAPPLAAQAQNPIGKLRVMQGPMVGAVTAEDILIWLRLSGPHTVELEYGRALDLSDARRSSAVTAKPENDFTVRVRLDDLTPDTKYFYRVYVDDRVDDYLETLPPIPVKTAPEEGARGTVRIAFGSCCRIQKDAVQDIWTAVERAAPDLFLWLGDNIYADTRSLDIFQEEYRRQRAVPSLQPVIRSIPQLATWDDHDYGLNNHDRTSPVKDIGLDAFKQYWANPSYGLPNTPGVFFKFTYGAVDLFMLDGRYYRDPNAMADGPDKTMLGEAQMEWLKEELKNSPAPFKLLVSGSGWSKAKGPTGDAWSAFLTERDALFAFIRDEQIDGVVLLSGDTHVAEANCIPFSEQGGYDMYDLTSSPLAQTPETSWQERRPEIRIRNPVFQSANAGMLHIDTDRDDPTLIYTVLDTAGRVTREPVVVAASDLRNGVTSWMDKIDATERARLERYRAGGPYYFPEEDA